MTPDETTTPHTEPQLRALLRVLADPAGLTVALMVVSEHLSDAPTVFDVPISADLAQEFLKEVTETAAAAAESELRPVDLGFVPAPQQWIHTRIGVGPLADLEKLVLAPTPVQYDRNTEFGRRNLLVLRVSSTDGRGLARVYQGFSPEKALQRGKRIFAFWTGERFASLDAQPLVIDRNLRLFTLGGTVLMKSNAAYESLFGALPDLRRRAATTYAATLGKLNIVGGDALRAACESDLNMMRKLSSIAHKMQQPGYPEALDMSSVLHFLERNTHIEVDIDRSGDVPALVFNPQPQRRWALLKLLDDDFLRSDLTNINYEANSKTEVGTP